MEFKMTLFLQVGFAFGISASLMTGSTIASAIGSQDIPEVRQVAWANVHLGKVHGGNGHIGLDLILPGDYTPQHNTDGREAFYGANCMANSGWASYYKVEGFSADGSNTFSHGIFIANEDTNICFNADAQLTPNCASTLKSNNTPLIKHNWANKLIAVALEMYPADTATYGGVRIGVGSFENYSNGGVYSPYLGDVNLPKAGDPRVGRMNGFFFKDGQPFTGNGRSGGFEAFQEGSTWTTSTGFPVSGFSAVGTNSDGYYSTSPLPKGRYKTYVTMVDKTADGSSKTRKIIVYLDVNTFNDRPDFHYERPCFGWGNCEVVTWE